MEHLAGPFYLLCSNNSLHVTKYDNSLRVAAIILLMNELKLTRCQGKLSYALVSRTGESFCASRLSSEVLYLSQSLLLNCSSLPPAQSNSCLSWKKKAIKEPGPQASFHPWVLNFWYFTWNMDCDRTGNRVWGAQGFSFVDETAAATAAAAVNFLSPLTLEEPQNNQLYFFLSTAPPTLSWEPLMLDNNTDIPVSDHAVSESLPLFFFFPFSVTQCTQSWAAHHSKSGRYQSLWK